MSFPSFDFALVRSFIPCVFMDGSFPSSTFCKARLEDTHCLNLTLSSDFAQCGSLGCHLSMTF